MRTKVSETQTNTNCDIINKLAEMDLKHIIDRILMYLESDSSSLENLEAVSGDWARIIYSSRFLYKIKVLFILCTVH